MDRCFNRNVSGISFHGQSISIKNHSRQSPRNKNISHEDKKYSLLNTLKKYYLIPFIHENQKNNSSKNNSKQNIILHVGTGHLRSELLISNYM